MALSMYSQVAHLLRTQVATHSLSRYLRGPTGAHAQNFQLYLLASFSPGWPSQLSRQSQQRGQTNRGATSRRAAHCRMPPGLSAWQPPLRRLLRWPAAQRCQPGSTAGPPFPAACATHLASRNASACPTAPPIHTASSPFQNLRSQAMAHKVQERGPPRNTAGPAKEQRSAWPSPDPGATACQVSTACRSSRESTNMAPAARKPARRELGRQRGRNAKPGRERQGSAGQNRYCTLSTIKSTVCPPRPSPLTRRQSRRP